MLVRSLTWGAKSPARQTTGVDVFAAAHNVLNSLTNGAGVCVSELHAIASLQGTFLNQYDFSSLDQSCPHFNSGDSPKLARYVWLDGQR